MTLQEATKSHHEFASMVVPIKYITPNGTLLFFSATTMFGTPVDVTLSELCIELMFPADAATAEALRSTQHAEAMREV
jgi:hypothetical protein